MAPETRDDLAIELSMLLSELDAAIAARLQEPRTHEGKRRREEVPPHRRRLRGVLSAAIRWFGGAARVVGH